MLFIGDPSGKNHEGPALMTPGLRIICRFHCGSSGARMPAFRRESAKERKHERRRRSQGTISWLPHLPVEPVLFAFSPFRNEKSVTAELRARVKPWRPPSRSRGG